MIQINLLPHRAEARRDRRNQTVAFMALAAAAAAGIFIFIYTFIAQLISAQEDKNVFIKSEIVKLEKDIDEIRKLQEQIQALLARKQVIESLQANRSEAVNMFNEFLKQTPDGVYLTKVLQKGQLITLNGIAESDSRVASLLKSLEASPFLEKPKLIEIKATQQDSRTVKAFTMEISIIRRTTEDKDKDKKGGGKSATTQKAA